MKLPKLYLITDRKQCDDLIRVVREALKAGCRMVQLREKDLNSRELYKLAREMRELTRKYDACLFINDRVDIALAVNADGVHVGKSSLPISVLKNIIDKHKKELKITYSAHSLREALRAEQEGVDWITFSPIFEISSKVYYGPAQGITRLKEVVNKLNIPVFALGGIKITNLSEIQKAGGHGIALISEIMTSHDPCKSTKALLLKL